MKRIDGFYRGVNLGGWLSQFEKGEPEHFSSFITKKDIETIAGWGLDHVRVPVDYMVLETEDGQERTEGYTYLDNCIEWCRQYGLHMILDLHKTYGYSFDPLDKDDKTAFFYHPALQQRFYDLWEKIAKRYGKYSDLLAFELLNEIVMPEVKDAWNEIALQAIRVIRGQAPDTWIIYGGVCYNSVKAVPWLSDPEDKKVAYTFHCYEPLIFTHQGAYWVNQMPSDFRIGYPESLEEYRKASWMLDRELAGAIYNQKDSSVDPSFFEEFFEPAVQIAQERDIPLYCGEYGVIDLAAKEDFIRWLKDIHSSFEKYGIGRALWNYKEKDFGISDDQTAAYLKDILTFM